MKDLTVAQDLPQQIATGAFFNDVFNNIFGTPDLFSTKNDGYPPFNSWSETDGSVKIEMAVAGFSRDDITVEFDGAALTVSGEKKEQVDEGDRKWLNRGLAKRKFTRRFMLNLNKAFSVEKAALKDGLLTITLKNNTKSVTVEVQDD